MRDRPPTLERRELGRVTGRDPGPTLVAVAGIHGNEPAGIASARRVFARLERGDVALRGELVALAGNVASLRRGVRYQSKDLNRQWSEGRVAALRALAADGELDAEDAEQVELLGAIEAAMARARGPMHVADLHTSSAQGVPFVLFGDTLAQRRFVGAFPIPVIIGLEEQVDGALSEYWTRRGCVTFTVEGGQHDDGASVEALEAVLWLALAEAGMVDRELAEVGAAYATLDARRGELPRVLEVVSRRAITAEDTFTMEPGFRNIARARAGQLLARDRRGDIVAPADGLVILPLYQGLGSDGFFWGREVSETRMQASRVLRRLGVDHLLALLPGVARDPERRSRFVVDPQVVKRVPLEVFQLFGYRRVRERGGALTVERQLD